VPFVTALIARDLGDGRNWVLVHDLVYKGMVDEFTVPARFTTDFASVPRLLQGIAPKLGRQNRSAVLHDWLYSTRPLVLRKHGYAPITRKDADGIFRRCMREDKVSWLRRWTFWTAVRLGGWVIWRRRWPA